MENCRAILLRKIKLSETSLILSWLSAEHGRIKTVAKGARQAKSRFAGRLDLFFECDIQFSRSRRGDLHALREADLLEAREGLRKDYLRVAMAACFVEWIELVTEPEHAVPEFFSLMQRALGYLDAHAANARALEHFESELLRLLGIGGSAPSACVALGRVYHRVPGARREVLARLR
jgi:DNA repair protein RecO (recombination protein O)